MQWFIRTTEELRDRIEDVYHLDRALRQLEIVVADVESISERIEQDLRPTKVQHEMRLRALEPLLEQIEENEQLRTGLVEHLNEMAAEIKNLRQEFTALKKVSTAKGEKYVEQTTEEFKKVRAELDGLRAQLSEPKEDHSAEEINALKQTLNAFEEKLSEPTEEIKLIRAELVEVQAKLSEPKDEPAAAEIKSLRSDIDGLKEKLFDPTEDINLIRADIDGLRAKLSEPKSDPSLEVIKKLRAEFQSILSAKDEELKQLWQLFEDKVAAKDEEIKQLRAQTAVMSTQLEDRGSAISELIRQIDYLWKKIEGMESKLETPPKVEKKRASKSSKATLNEEEPKIMLFEIEPNGEAYISGTPEEITTKLKAAMNVEELQTFLESSKAANKIIFLRSLDRHVRNLQKLTYKLNFDEFGAGQASEEITKRYFEIFRLTLLESVTSTSYRGLVRQSDFYREFLQHFNRYLQRCGIYTRRVLPNGRITEQDLIDMKLTRRDTVNAANDGLIIEVERLPYYIDYLDAAGELKHLFFEGRMLVYSLSQ